MPTKPALLTTWASGSPSNRVATGAAKEALGWLPGEKPPAEWFNYWMHNVYSWVGYLNLLRATDVPATYGGSANSTVQAAIDGLGASITSAVSALNTRINALPLAGSVGLTAVTPPSVNATTPDLWSGASGGICVPGAGGTSTLYPEGSAGDITVSTASNWSPGWGDGAGIAFKNLTLNAPVNVIGLKGPFVLRVHGNLTLNAPLSFYADANTGLAYASMYISNPFGMGFGPYCAGGAGVMGEGGPYGSVRLRHFNPSVNLSLSGTSTSATTQAVDLLALLRTMPALGAVGAMAPWIRGGGQSGGTGSGTSLSGPLVNTPGGGFAVVLVSGDIVIGVGSGMQGAIRCNGMPGYNTNEAGAGGGGGGALIVICGGRIRASGTTLKNAFQAKGGWGGAGPSIKGSGGGGGLVYLCARNLASTDDDTITDTDLAEYAVATGGGSAGGASQTGAGGKVIIFQAIPRLMA